MTDTPDTEESVDPSWAVQTAIYDRLRERLPDVDIIDNVEAAEYENALPFILIGDDILSDDDNQITNQYKIRTFIRCHAEGPHRKASKALAHRVRNAMRDDFEIDGFISDDLISKHVGTQNALVEGVAHVAVVEWLFDLLEDNV